MRISAQKVNVLKNVISRETTPVNRGKIAKMAQNHYQNMAHFSHDQNPYQYSLFLVNWDGHQLHITKWQSKSQT